MDTKADVKDSQPLRFCRLCASIFAGSVTGPDIHMDQSWGAPSRLPGEFQPGKVAPYSLFQAVRPLPAAFNETPTASPSRGKIVANEREPC